MARMHIDELDIDEALVRRLLAEQFPEWADQSLSRVGPAGTDNAIFRLGQELSLRLARRDGPRQPGGKEFDWLPRWPPRIDSLAQRAEALYREIVGDLRSIMVGGQAMIAKLEEP